jgi:hypothetical protein
MIWSLKQNGGRQIGKENLGLNSYRKTKRPPSKNMDRRGTRSNEKQVEVLDFFMGYESYLRKRRMYI